MTVAKPFTQREIESRDRFDFFRAEQKDVRETAPLTASETGRSFVCRWNLDAAVEILASQPHCHIKTRDDRRRCEKEIVFVLFLYILERRAEAQETNASKASTFQRAPRWNKRRQRIRARLENAARKDVGLAQKARAELLAVPWLPPSLEQEAACLQAKGASPDESFMMLRDKYKHASIRGPIKSHALTHAIHRLQALASNYARNLTWRGRNIPEDLRAFILETLDVPLIEHAGLETRIKHPGFVENPSKFRRLLSKLPLKARSSRRVSDAPASVLALAEYDRRRASALVWHEPITAAECELERRLSKMPL